MKLGPTTKPDKATSKKVNDDVMSKKFDVTAFFFNLRLIWSNPEAGFRMHSL